MNNIRVNISFRVTASHYLLFTLLLIQSATAMSYSGNSGEAKVKILIDTEVFPLETFNACHASTIVELTPDEFMSAWFAGSHEGANDVAIWISKFQNGNWSTPKLAAKGFDSLGNQIPCWNPVLFKTKKGTLFLFYKAGPNPREWWGMVMRSTDNGKNWTEPEALPDNFLGSIRSKPIQLPDGTILCPSSEESIDTKKWTVHMEITNEELSSWKRVDVQADSGVGVIQPTILSHPDGKLQILCRSRQNVIYESWSDDNGISWSKLNATSVPNPNSGIDSVELDNGLYLLVYNPLLQGKDWFYGRNVLNAAVSENGTDWKDIYVFENEKEGEFSYPAVIRASDNSIHVTYTWNRKTIRHIVFKVTNEPR